MVADYRAFALTSAAQPRYKSTAVMRACLRDPDTESLVEDPTGVASLWRNGVQVLDAVPLEPDTQAGPFYLKLILSHTLLSERGDYKWEIVVTDPATGYTGTDEGRFKL